MSTDWIDELRVVDLKEELKKRDLAISGKKAELAARLLEAVEKEGSRGGKEAQAAEATPEEQLPAKESKDGAPAVTEAAAEETEEAGGDQDEQMGDAAPPAVLEAQAPAEALPQPDQDSGDKAPATTPSAPAEEELEQARPTEIRDESEDLQAAEPAALPAASVVSEPAQVTKPADTFTAAEDKLAPMQAALLAPRNAVAEGNADVDMEEEIAVDFEADDEPPVATPAPAQSQATAEKTTAGKKSKPAESSEQPSSKRQKQEEPGTDKPGPSTGKPKREPIPLFKPKSQKAETVKQDSTPAPSRTGSDTKASVFDRIVSQGEGVVLPKGSGAPPSRTKASCALLVTGFVRPFRVPAAQDLFKQHGEVKTFWMSSVRDKAYVVFDSEEAAEKARQATHGLEWPERSRTSLRPKFVPVEEAEEVIKSNGASLPARTSGLFSSRNSGGASLTPSTSNAAAAAAAAAAGAPLEKRKSVQASAQEEAKEVKKTAKPVEEPQDDADQFGGLFRKTSTKPNLYWLPLTKEQIAAKKSAVHPPSQKAS